VEVVTMDEGTSGQRAGKAAAIFAGHRLLAALEFAVPVFEIVASDPSKIDLGPTTRTTQGRPRP
jgi:hypothetical protein